VRGPGGPRGQRYSDHDLSRRASPHPGKVRVPAGPFMTVWWHAEARSAGRRIDYDYGSINGEPMPNQLNTAKLRDYARAGAEAALKQLRAEIVAIERTFPELALRKRRRAIRKS